MSTEANNKAIVRRSIEEGWNQENARRPPVRQGHDDRVLLATRVVSALVVPFLVLGFILLYVLPDRTGELFAWAVQPRMTAMLLGGAYLVGAYFFVRAATATHWHSVAIGFLPVTVFALLMAIATVLHWDRFNHAHPAFLAWVFIYFATSILVPIAWLLNRRTDAATQEATDQLVPAGVRRVLGILGAGTLLLSLLFYLQPQLMIAVWPWHLSALTGRVMAALFSLTGAGEMAIALDARWSAVRIALQGQMIALVVVVGAIIFSWQDFHATSLLTWVLGAGMLFLLLLASPLLYIWMERGSVQH